MSLPPPPEPYGSQPPSGGGQPGGGGVPPQWGPQQGGPPPGFGGYGPPPQGPWPQPQWHGGPGGQPPKGGKGKWILGGVAVVLAIALTVVVTVLVVRPAGGGGGTGDPTQPNGGSEFASADDTGPVNIITEDPTCAAWSRISREYSALLDEAGWKNRDKASPAASWTPEQRRLFETVSDGMDKAAKESADLARQTPSRLMRELYQEFIAYNTVFINKVPDYRQDDEKYVAVSNTLVSVLSNICSAIQYQAAQAIESLVGGVSPSGEAQRPSTADSSMFLKSGDPQCNEWLQAVSTYNSGVVDWQQINPSIPASEWTPEQKQIVDRVAPLMSEAADRFESIGQASENAVFQDFAILTAQYIRAYVATLPAYTSAGNYLIRAGNFLGGTVDAACKAAE